MGIENLLTRNEMLTKKYVTQKKSIKRIIVRTILKAVLIA